MEPNPKGSKLFAVCEIRPYLLISGYCALSEPLVRKLRVTHAVDATNIPKTLRVDGVEYLSVNVDDSDLGDLSAYFEPCAKLVTEAKNSGGKALIYCAAGISRSAALCITALMQIEGLTLREAYTAVLVARPMIAPNLGFWRQMIAFEARLSGGKTTVELLKGMRRPVPSVYLNRSGILNSNSQNSSSDDTS